MAERNDLPRIVPQKKGMLQNDGAGTGAAIGGAVAGAALFANNRFSTLGLFVGPVIGGLVGGFIGKVKENREQTQGRVVKDPVYFNRGLFNGVALGLMTLPVFGIFALPVAGVFGIAGSILRRHEMKSDLKVAERMQQLEVEQIQNALRMRELGGYKNSVSPQEVAALAARQGKGDTANFAANVDANRAATAEAGRA